MYIKPYFNSLILLKLSGTNLLVQQTRLSRLENMEIGVGSHALVKIVASTLGPQGKVPFLNLCKESNLILA